MDTYNVKATFTGAFNKSFSGITLYNDVTTWRDVQVKDNQLYIKGVHIPIRKTLVGSAVNEFVMAKNSGFNNVYLEFLVDPDGGYMIRHNYHNNTVERLLTKAIFCLTAKEYRKPCIQERK